MSVKRIEKDFSKYQCPSCRNPIQTTLGEKAQYVVCVKCNKLFHNEAGILTFSASFKKTFTPVFPIGSGGEYKNKKFKLIGALEVKEANTNYYWREYIVQFEDETVGYFMEYDGHWSYVEQIPAIVESTNRKEDIEYDNEWYVFFNTYKSVNVAAEGDFFWNIVDTIKPQIYEYINPPYGLVAEYKKTEINWYRSEYITPTKIKSIFNRYKTLPDRTGRYSIQPLPFAIKPGALAKLCFCYIFVMAVVMSFLTFFNNEQQVYDTRQDLHKSIVSLANPYYNPNLPNTLDSQYVKTSVYSPDSNVFVTPPFTVSSTFNSTALDVVLEAPVQNNWFEASSKLVNETTGQEYYFELGVEYYYGSDWSEGSKENNVTLSEVPDGRYRLIVKPFAGTDGQQVMSYRISVSQGVTLWSNFFLISFAALLIPVSMLIYVNNFNASRWLSSNII